MEQDRKELKSLAVVGDSRRSSAKRLVLSAKKRKKAFTANMNHAITSTEPTKSSESVHMQSISPSGTFLAKCQHCRNRKTYGANYNAAAHLRRVHFDSCRMLKGGPGKRSLPPGGIRGGDQPPMDVLRNRMVEIWERNMGGLLLDDS